MKKPAKLDDFLIPLQVALALAVPEKKVLQWIDSGELVAVNVGRPGRGQWRISPKEFDRFLESRSTAKGARS